MRVPLVDLQAQHASIGGDVRAAIDRVLARQRFILGEEVAAFERELGALLDPARPPEIIGVSSGTDALLAALLAVGVVPGDEVVTTPFTFVSTVESIVRLGARPVYVDLEPGTFHPSSEAFERVTTSRTRAFLFVHLYGGCVDLGRLAAQAKARGVALVEDAAQAILSRAGDTAAGTFGDVGTFSFFPSKNLGACGDAGAVVTRNAEIGSRVRALRNHGQTTKYDARLVGGNFRLDELQAAILRAKLPHLRGWTEARQRHAARYREHIGARVPAATLALPCPRANENHTFHQLVVRTDRRDALRAFLATREVQSEVYYPSPMHRQAAWRADVDLPEADRACREVLALPVYPELAPEQLATVEDACVAFFADADETGITDDARGR